MMWDNQASVSAWSKIATWQTGLLQKSDWKDAAWIGYDVLPDTSIIIPHVHGNGKKIWGKRPDVLPLLRKEFTINKTVKDATIFICGLGQFELSINGQKTGDHFLDPGWTKYDKHALYVPFDVTQQLQQGKNAIGVMLGNGFYYIPGERYRKMTGAYGYPKMICRLIIHYTDGSEESILSNASWKTIAGPVIFSSIYGGEDYDATKERVGWNQADFNESGWKNVVLTTGPPELEAQTAEPVKIMESFLPKKVTQPKPGIWVYDMGQNASAIPYIEVSGKRGDTVKIIPGELLKEDGTVTQSNTGGPHIYQYVLKGGGIEKWQPSFTYYGFRYIQVEGAERERENNTSGQPVLTAIKSLHPRNAMQCTGGFQSSNNLFNRTDTLIDWAIKSNIVSVMTDCPHREKLGWLEEAHLVGASVRYHYDIAALCKKIIRDMQMSQTLEGLVPEISPEFVRFDEPFRDSPEWGSNCILLPWYMYQWYGDKQILEESYPMMQRYITYLQSKDSAGLLKQGLSDWYDIGPNRPGLSQNTPQGLTATAFYYYDLQLMRSIAGIVGKKDDAYSYYLKSTSVQVAFNKKFFNPATKQYGTGSQTANAIAVYMGLVNAEDKAAVIENIVNDIRSRKNALTAGDIGFRYLLRVLDEAGRGDVIFDMNNRSDVPGYGYQLEKGATALTESWQALPSVSNNHFMLGHILEWFYSGLAGIRPAPNDIGFRNIEIRPQPVRNVTSAQASYQSHYGEIKSEWIKSNDKFELNVIIPPNTKAVVYLPGSAPPVKIGSGSYSYSVPMKL
jgi:alpha-L-rhamnosidase